MIWRLEYCNKDGVEARLDIIRGALTPVEVIEGTETPFILNYKMDKPDKSGHVMSSSADISIFETPTFNIDNLKTSSETEIKVEHYINGVLDWSGFVIPDFFSKTIGTPATVEMVASDRLGTLKGVTLDDLNQYESMRSLAVKCLAKTGLSLPLYTMADFGNAGQTNAFFKALGLSGRLSDTKGRNISCYNILKSILVASESKLVQQSGAWYIVNKWQHEQGSGNLFSSLTASTAYSEQTVNFSDVHAGARRSIIPVGATTGVFHEFGGGRSYPDNFDFADGLSGWTTAGTFVATIDNREITGYDFGPIGATIRFGDPTDKNYLLNKNVFNVANYIQSADIDVPYDTGRIEVVLDINAIGPRMSQAIAAANLRVSVGATSGSQTLWLNTSGLFQSGSVIIHNLYFSRGVGNFETANFSVKGVLEQPSGYNVFVRIYGSNEAALDLRETAVNFATISFNNTIESPKGLIYRRNQGTGFTKEHDIDTSIFGDYMRKGLDGYFYEYRIDDTSSLYSTAGTLTEPLWTAHGDTEQLPLLRHVTRQKSRMFSVAHNMISARVDVATFKPLNIFVDCNSVNPRHVVVSATYDFLRSEVEVELEQIAYTTLDVREYIYSYFGDGEPGISSVGGISGGGTGTGGGGMTAEQIELLNTVAGYWTLDVNGNLKTTYNAYSEQELSAYGFGSGGGGEGGAIATLSDVQLTGLTSGQILEYNGTHWINVAKPSGGGSVAWADITGKPTTFTPSAHSHAIGDVTGLQTALDGKASTSHSHTIGDVTGLQTALDGKAPTSHTHIKSQITDFAHTHPFTEITGTATTSQIPDLAISKITGLQTALDLKLNKSIFDDFFEWDAINNAIKAKHTFYSTGEVSAYGFGGSGGGGGGGSLVTWSNETAEKVTLTVEGIAKDLSKLGHTHSNYALSTTSILVGNGLTGGGNLTANRTISLSATTIGDIAQGVQAKSAIDGLEIGGRNYFSIYDFVADNKARGYNTIYVITHNGNIAYRSTNIVNNQNIPRYLQGKFEANTQYYFKFNILWESFTNSSAQYVFTIRYTDGSTSTVYADTSHTYRVILTSANKTIDYITTTRQFDGTVVIYNIQIKKENKLSDWVIAPEDTQRADWITSGVFDIARIPTGTTGTTVALGNHTHSGVYEPANANIQSHISATNNPHSVTAGQVGAYALGSNVASATKLQTSRTIWGQSFDGTGNISGNMTGVEGITATGNNIITSTGDLRFGVVNQNGAVDLLASVNMGVYDRTNAVWLIGTNRTNTFLMDGNVGIGTTSPSYKLDVSGTGRFTGNLTAPKVIFSAAGWAMVQTGTELQMQYNGVAKMRFLNGGSIVAVQEITAYG